MEDSGGLRKKQSAKVDAPPHPTPVHQHSLMAPLTKPVANRTLSSLSRGEDVGLALAL